MSDLEFSVKLLMPQIWLVYGIISLGGLIIGSFINVIVFRLPKFTLSEVDSSDWPLFVGRSKCPACGFKIRWYENVPVISFLWLVGRCSDCRKPISLRYPLVEILVATFAVLIFWNFGATWEAVARFAFCCLLVALSLIDFDHYFLPDVLSLPAIWIGLFINAFDFLTPAREAILGAAFGWGCLGAINIVYKFVSKQDGIGRGDWKFAAVIGAWLGCSGVFISIIIAFLAGAIVGVALLIRYRGSLKKVVPFGPFLAIGSVVVIFFGPDLTHWYLHWLIQGV